MLLLDFESCLVSFHWPFLTTRSINTNNCFQHRPVMQANSHERVMREGSRIERSLIEAEYLTFEGGGEGYELLIWFE